MATKHIPTAQPLPTREQAKAYVEGLVAANPGTIPPNLLTQEDVWEWFDAQEQLEKLKAKEMSLRLKIFRHYFPSPLEGTNDMRLPDGFVVKGVHKITREVDPAALDALKKLTVGEMREQLTNMSLVHAAYPDETPLLTFLQVSTDKLIKYDPALVIKEYRTLTAEQRKVFEQCLVVKDGAPALKIVPPSAKSEAAGA